MQVGHHVTDTAVAITAVLRRRAAADGLWVEARGGSMGRRYPPGTRLLVAPLGRSPRSGEVWVFVDTDGEVVAHRCVCRRDTATIWFRGDASIRFDTPVALERLVGRAVLVDDGSSRWTPHWSHALGPSVGAVVLHMIDRLTDSAPVRKMKGLYQKSGRGGKLT
jgi:hypothetical protein